MTTEAEYFKRQIQLWGENTQISLKNKKIAVIGCGGLGCSVAIALGSSGIGDISLVDFDIVDDHNIHRQIAFTTKDTGYHKSKVLKNLIKSRCPFVNVVSYEMNFERFSQDCNDDFDLIIDATDNLEVRVDIDNFCKKASIPWVYGSVEEFHGQVCFFDKSKFETIFNVTKKVPKGIAAPIVMMIAAFQSNIAIRYLAGLPIEKDKLFYHSFDSNGVFDLKQFSIPV